MLLRNPNLVAAFGLSALLAMPVHAQQAPREQNRDRQNESSQQESRPGDQQNSERQSDRFENQNREDRDSESRTDENQNQRQLRNQHRQSENDNRRQGYTGQRRSNFRGGEIEGWVTVGTDYDNDGVYDSLETIFLIDLENARRQSQARAQEHQRSRNQNGQHQSSKRLQVKGTIQSLSQKEMMNSEKPKVVAKLKTQEGRTATVCLGSQDKVNQLNLQQGDQVQAHGVRATFNGKSMLMAERVSAGEQTITNQLPRKQGLNRFQGEVVSTRQANFRNREGEFVIATVRTEKHGTKEVNLGHASEFENVDISEGKQIKFLAGEARMNGRSALIAQAIRIDGQTIDVRESTNQQITKSDRGSDSKNRQSEDRQTTSRR
ncbi:hypothetical protein [Rubinisphaera margarita]|uniref:hypothetical protein n=1 Tax=Rubinisphaera margarita TaxID=2909586 RepID=UPI001EE95CB4|nr:hypothetical protein [Rubinisphaera margarita]MCG6156537.1 hypothetical protein [Rubinisphaera margarita]